MTFTGRGLYASSSKVPRRRRFGWLLAGALIALVALVFSAVTGFGMITTTAEQRSASFEDVTAVAVDNDTDGTITVVGTEGSAVTVERETRSSLWADAQNGLKEEGGTLRATADCDVATPFGECAVDYRIEVPEGTDLDLSVVTGRIEVAGVAGDVKAYSVNGAIGLTRVTGSIDAESVDGPVWAEGSGERAKAASETGTIDLRDFAAENVEVRSTTGMVSLGDGFDTAEVGTTTGEVNVETATPFTDLAIDSATGSVHIEVPAGDYAVTGDSGPGGRSVRVGTDPDAQSAIDVSTTTGAVRIEPAG